MDLAIPSFIGKKTWPFLLFSFSEEIRAGKKIWIPCRKELEGERKLSSEKIAWPNLSKLSDSKSGRVDFLYYSEKPIDGSRVFKKTFFVKHLVLVRNRKGCFSLHNSTLSPTTPDQTSYQFRNFIWFLFQNVWSGYSAKMWITHLPPQHAL